MFFKLWIGLKNINKYYCIYSKLFLSYFLRYNAKNIFIIGLYYYISSKFNFLIFNIIIKNYYK
jgi:hypothetical protein